MIYCCMTDFSTCSMSTANDFSINNDSTANSCSQSYEDYILRSCCCTFPCLSKCCYIGIISGFGRKSCQFCEFFCITASPAGCPKESLTCLKRFASMMAMDSMPSRCAR